MEARRLEQEDKERWREERVQDRELEVEGKRSSEVLVGSCEGGVMVRGERKIAIITFYLQTSMM